MAKSLPGTSTGRISRLPYVLLPRNRPILSVGGSVDSRWSTINRSAILGQLAWEMGAANGEQVTKLPKSDEQVAAGEAVRA